MEPERIEAGTAWPLNLPRSGFNVRSSWGDLIRTAAAIPGFKSDFDYELYSE
ncbi:hypothetical protein E4U09_005396, partial [Claviceps aff. purpurea]